MTKQVVEFLNLDNISNVFRENRWWVDNVCEDYINRHGEAALTRADRAVVCAETFRLLFDIMQVRPVPTRGLNFWLTLAACWCVAMKTTLDVDSSTHNCVEVATRQLEMTLCHLWPVPAEKGRIATRQRWRQLHGWEIQLLSDLEWRVSPVRAGVVHPSRATVPHCIKLQTDKDDVCQSNPLWEEMLEA